MTPHLRRALSGLLLALAAGAFVVALEQPKSLFVNLGPGDAPFARGFRAGWERDGLVGSGETTFHWTQDGSRLEFPLDVRDGELTLRLRLARFSDTPAEIRLRLDGEEVASWSERPHAWEVREIALGPRHGLASFQFRSESKDGLGVALDWAELLGARRILPRPPVARSLALLFLGVPLLVGLVLGRRAGFGFAVGLLLAGALAVHRDRLGGLMAFSEAALPALLVLGLLAALGLGLLRAWGERAGSRESLLVPFAVALAVSLALAHPFFHYPDVDTHARFASAIRADPFLAWDPSEWQARTGAWTRSLGGRQVRFPYSPFFHLLAQPLLPLIGDVAAVKALGALALGLSLFLIHALARGLGLPRSEALLAQLLLALLPVTASRLSLALFPTLLGQAMELLLAVHLLRRFPHLQGARDAAAAAAFVALALVAYTGSVFSVGMFVVMLASAELVAGDRRVAARLLGSAAVAALLVVGLLYGRFVPTLIQDVLPYAGRAPSGAAAARPGVTAALVRLESFYDWVYPLLLVPGFLGLRRAPPHARRIVSALLDAGLLLLAGRYLLPGLLRDAKDVELLAAPMALLSAAGCGWLWRAGLLGRLAALASLAAAAQWGATRAVAVYAERFFALGR